MSAREGLRTITQLGEADAGRLPLEDRVYALEERVADEPEVAGVSVIGSWTY
jgi:hypothetical protein